MSRLAWAVAVGALGWPVLALAVGVLIGRVIELADATTWDWDEEETWL